MLWIHYVSIMMRIFYIDWQQHWKCDRTMNANAHGKRTGSTKEPQVTDLTPVSPLTVGLPVTSERYWACFQVIRLFHSATIVLLLHMYLFETSPGWLPGWRIFFFFLPWFGGGALSSNVFTICAVYWSLGRRGYFGVSNVALVSVSFSISFSFKWIVACRLWVIYVREDRLWLHSLYGLYGPRFPLSPERPLNLITHSLVAYKSIHTWPPKQVLNLKFMQTE